MNTFYTDSSSLHIVIKAETTLRGPHTVIRHEILSVCEMLYLGVTHSPVNSMLTGDRGFRLLQLELPGHRMKQKRLTPRQQGGTLEEKHNHYHYSSPDGFALFYSIWTS